MFPFSQISKPLTVSEALAYLKTQGDVFSVIQGNKSSIHVSQVFTQVKKAIISNNYDSLPVAPIQVFQKPFWNLESYKTFLSSGTTSLASRSKSSFSQKGIWCYDAAALVTFLDVLSRFFSCPEKIRGYCLVPPSHVWPDSSLAHMVSLFARHLPVEFIGLEDVPHLNPQEPVWVFGTAGHFMELQKGCILPSGSLVFETGGQKRGQKSMPREAFYERLCGLFGIEQAHIVSEYGMCELASQAYDFHEPLRPYDFAKRRFRFPFWVDIFSYGGLDSYKKQGQGALALLDRARVDIPFGILTQDICEIDGSGFSLQKRVPFSVLKGCSNNLKSTKNPSPTAVKNAAKVFLPDMDAVLERFFALQKSLFAMVEEPETFDLLVSEFQSEKIAKWAQQEIISSLQARKKDLAPALAGANNLPTYKHWLLILPKNHSIAAIHPLLWAASLGLTLSVRVPENLQGTIIKKVIALFKKSGAQIHTTAKQFRLGQTTQNPPPYNAILAMGHDDTIEGFHKTQNLPLQGFGSYQVAVSCEAEKVFDYVDELLFGCFALGQRGCLSGRAILVEGSLSEKKVKNLACLLRDRSREIFDRPLSLEMRLCLDGQYLDLKDRSLYMPDRQGHEEGLFPVVDHRGKQDELSLVPVPFVCPVVLISPSKQLPLSLGFDKIIPAWKFSLPLDSKKWKAFDLWHGYHQGQLLFYPDAD